MLLLSLVCTVLVFSQFAMRYVSLFPPPHPNLCFQTCLKVVFLFRGSPLAFFTCIPRGTSPSSPWFPLQFMSLAFFLLFSSVPPLQLQELMQERARLQQELRSQQLHHQREERERVRLAMGGMETRQTQRKKDKDRESERNSQLPPKVPTTLVPGSPIMPPPPRLPRASPDRTLASMPLSMLTPSRPPAPRMHGSASHSRSASAGFAMSLLRASAKANRQLEEARLREREAEEEAEKEREREAKTGRNDSVQEAVSEKLGVCVWHFFWVRRTVRVRRE